MSVLRVRPILRYILAGLVAGFLSGAAHAAEPIDLVIDFAKILQLDRPATTIIVGNPGIADATVEDQTTLVLTGKAPGTTNLIALDAEGAEIANATIRVASNDRQLTTIFYGAKRQTLSCAPVCEQVISIGDANEKFQEAASQIQARKGFSGGQ
ncbi:pilus assembly protein N-terminal domain-containing protein [Afifella sp. IM 167]|uniref:pilus assembly protein N-terminal domain-containing protein n=1 Tax=Afifella sp. IM 167 TaxID=2033586 RepID=UPI001CCA22E9|nr:pilus assembly protein N-terminal domain-containing protein [Afifella sp. IM 167]MBZ8133773.1 hypothetical protein [Afifella sp. IM 167]